MKKKQSKARAPAERNVTGYPVFAIRYRPPGRREAELYYLDLEWGSRPWCSRTNILVAPWGKLISDYKDWGAQLEFELKQISLAYCNFYPLGWSTPRTKRLPWRWKRRFKRYSGRGPMGW